MSKEKPKYNSLPKLQKKIVLCLAREGPMIIRETNTKIKGEYTSTNRAFHELEAKDMITKIDVMPYRGREFPKYWLTIRGLGWALLNNAKALNLKEYALRVSRNDEDRNAIEAYFELRESGGPKAANTFDKFIFLHGKLELTKLLINLLPDMLSINKSETEKLFETAKKYPYWKLTEETIRKMMNELKRVLSHE